MTPAVQSRRMFTVREVAARLAIRDRQVLNLIARNQLRAIDVSASPGRGRPTWRIPQDAIDEFEASRAPAPKMPRARRKRQPEGVVEFYPS